MNAKKNYFEVNLSQVGVNEDSGLLQKWFVEEGQFISVGTIICEFETTKTIIEIEAENEGFIVPIVEETAKVNIGSLIAIIVLDKEKIKSIRKKFLPIINKVINKNNEKYKITKKAKDLIDKHEIDLNTMPINKEIIRTKDVLSIIKGFEQGL